MIDRERLLEDLQRLLRGLEDDLRERVEADEALSASLREEHRGAREAGRTGESFVKWREGELTQAAMHWVLGCVFVRFLEDNELIDPRLAGPGERMRRAEDERTLYFREHPTHSDREYLLHVFREMAKLPTGERLFDERHNPLFRIPLSADGARELLGFFQGRDPDTGALHHDFTDPEWNTRFLGDLYQDLSKEAQKRYALLQTPEFVEEFILDRTLEPAIEEFGLGEVRLLDPACGSGHFLLGALSRLLERAQRAEPGAAARVLTQRALDQICGVDVNPFAVAVARFRLLIAALRASDAKRLEKAPAFRLNVAAGDSLLHGRRFGPHGHTPIAHQPTLDPTDDLFAHVFEVEDADELQVLLGRQYHVVVGNPPYITVKDRSLGQIYRDKYETCYRVYSLVAPFVQRFFQLAKRSNENGESGYVGLIASNAFMKREFGRKLIEEFLPGIDLTHVVDTSGAYIPGHDTPTLILLGRARSPVSSSVRAVLGVRGEPAPPANPAHGKVWASITKSVDRPGCDTEYVSVVDLSREWLRSFPWSLQGGGAADLKNALDSSAAESLRSMAEAIGLYQDTHADEAFVQPRQFVRRHGLWNWFRPQVRGDEIRDWSMHGEEAIFFPFDERLELVGSPPATPRWSWLFDLKPLLLARSTFDGRTYREAERPWYDYHQFPRDRARARFLIPFAFVTTHNHFALDRGGTVFNRSAPLVKLSPEFEESEHLEILGLLNSSIACFWMKQVFHNKGLRGQAGGITSEAWEQFREFAATALWGFPLPECRPIELARELDRLATKRQGIMPGAWVEELADRLGDEQGLEQEASHLLGRMAALQEELDWFCYHAYGVLDQPLQYKWGDLPELRFGERAFEIAMARRMASGELETTWFERHRSTPITELPSHWPEGYRTVVEKRLATMVESRDIRLIEQPEYKRRWNVEPWEDQLERALREWLAGRLEDARYWPELELQSTARLADRATHDPDFVRVAEVYRGRADFDLPELVAELVAAESVPFLPALRYKALGLRKRGAWEETWALQRQEDAIDARTQLPSDDPEHLSEAEVKQEKAREVGDIPVPPRYTSGDFRSSMFWRLRGRLDVPKERFVSYPHGERDADPSLVVGWAGWDHLQEARALAAWYVARKEQDGWERERLQPLLAGLLELVPWLQQWHNELDPEYGERMGDYFAAFVEGEARALGLTLPEIRGWEPPKKRGRRGGRKKAGKTAKAGKTSPPESPA